MEARLNVNSATHHETGPRVYVIMQVPVQVLHHLSLKRCRPWAQHTASSIPGSPGPLFRIFKFSKGDERR